MSNYVTLPTPTVVLQEDFDIVQAALQDDARNQQYKETLEMARERAKYSGIIRAINEIQWKNRVPDEPLTLCQIVPWVSDGPDFTCVHCKRVRAMAYDVCLEWGDTGSYESMGWTCRTCVRSLVPELVHDGKTQLVQKYIDKCTP